VATRKLPALDFVVSELILEAVGGPGAQRARTLAETLEMHVMQGTSLGKHRKELARAVGSFSDRSARVRTLRVLSTEAERAGDDEILALLEKLEPGTRAKLEQRAEQESAKTCLAFCDKVGQACLQGKPVRDTDAAKLVSWLGTPAEGRGYARIDLGYRACVALMRVLGHGQAGKNVRKALEAMLDHKGAGAHDARRALVAAAAYQERWPEVDALSKVTGPAVAAVASGLGIAAGHRLSDRSLAQARLERGAPLPNFRPELESRLRAIAKRGPKGVTKQCDEVLSRLARGR
jgi:hypothetical protein